MCISVSIGSSECGQTCLHLHVLYTRRHTPQNKYQQHINLPNSFTNISARNLRKKILQNTIIYNHCRTPTLPRQLTNIPGQSSELHKPRCLRPLKHPHKQHCHQSGANHTRDQTQSGVDGLRCQHIYNRNEKHIHVAAASEDSKRIFTVHNTQQ